MDARSPTQLVILMHAGDQHAAHVLYARFGPRILGALRTLVPDPARAEDSVQQAFVRILALDADQVRAIDDPLAWLVRTARNCALNDRRACGRADARDRAAARREPGAALPSDGFDDLRRALDALPADDRELLVLKHIAGLTLDQIAFALDENRNTIGSRLRAAVVRLHTVLTVPEAAHAR